MKLGTLCFRADCHRLRHQPLTSFSLLPLPATSHNYVDEVREASALLPLCQAQGDEDVRPFITALGRYLCYLREL